MGQRLSFLQSLLLGRMRRLRQRTRRRTLLSASQPALVGIERLEDRTLLSAVIGTENTSVNGLPDGTVAAEVMGPLPASLFQQMKHVYITSNGPSFQDPFASQDPFVSAPKGTSGINPQLQLVSVNETEAIGVGGQNNAIGTAEFITGFGTAAGKDPVARISGNLIATTGATTIGPFAEDDGDINRANDTGLTLAGPAPVTTVIVTGASIGDGPFGSTTGTPSGDFDFYKISGLTAGQRITADVDTANPFGPLDPVLAIWDASGNQLAANDDDAVSLDSFLSFTVPTAGDYFVSVMGDPTTTIPNPFDSSSGTGATSEGTYGLTISLVSEVDFYSFDLNAGDIIGANVTGTGELLTLFDPSGNEIIGSQRDIATDLPTASPLPTGGNVSLAAVAAVPGTYTVGVVGRTGSYNLDLKAFRPVLSQQAGGAVQTLFLDFNGITLDTAIFGSSGVATLSGLAGSLTDWGLTLADESVVIDSIIATVQENLSADIRARGNNGDFDATGINGQFDIQILNSRDDLDPFGNPNASRVAIGGTIAELGFPTIGVAESVDVGNFETSETAVVLLDTFSSTNPLEQNSLNNVTLGTGQTIIGLIGRAIGNAVSHEAGHLFGNFHTSNSLTTRPDVMDPGGNLFNSVGLGADSTFGTADDVDVDFGRDLFDISTGLTGTQDTLNTIAFGLSGGGAPTPTGGFDFGDAPEAGTSFPTTLANDGARHAVGGTLFLGATIDGEANGQPNSIATGDGSDEDGVTFVGGSLFVGDVQSKVDVFASETGGLLDAWIDFNRDGDWNDAGEHIFAGRALTAGTNRLSFTVPASIGSDVNLGNTFARFRLSTAGPGTPNGLAPDGEVEDYQVSVVAQHKGTVTFDRPTYDAGDTVTITVHDGDIVGAGTINVIVTGQAVTAFGDAGRDDMETVALTEVGFGEFVGTISSSAAATVIENGNLEVIFGEKITVTYHDADTGAGLPGSFAEAVIDGTDGAGGALLISPRDILFAPDPGGSGQTLIFVSNGRDGAAVTDHKVQLFGLDGTPIRVFVDNQTPAPTGAVGGVAVAGSVVTITTTAAHGLTTGQKVTLSGITVFSGPNINVPPSAPHTITVTSPTEFTLNGFDGTGGFYIAGVGSMWELARDILRNPNGIAINPNAGSVGEFLVVSEGTGQVLFTNREGTNPLQQFGDAGGGGLLDKAREIAFGPADATTGIQDLYVTDEGKNQVLRFDGVTGAFKEVVVAGNEFQQINITGGTPAPGDTFTLSFTFDGVTETTGPIKFDVNGEVSAATIQTELLKLNDINPGEILVSQGSLPKNSIDIFFIGAKATVANKVKVGRITVDNTGMASGAGVGVGGLTQAFGIVFDSSGNMFVSSNDTTIPNVTPLLGGVYRYNSSGVAMGRFIEPGFASGGLGESRDLAFGPDGNLYVTSNATDSILRFDQTTGAFIEEFTFGNAVQQPFGLAFGPNPAAPGADLYVVDRDNSPADPTGSLQIGSVKKFTGPAGEPAKPGDATDMADIVATNGFDFGDAPLTMSKIQQLVLTGIPAAGDSFTLTFDDDGPAGPNLPQTTAAITLTPTITGSTLTAAAVEAALEAKTAIDVTVTGGNLPGSPITVDFAGMNLLSFVVDNTGMSGGSAVSVRRSFPVTLAEGGARHVVSDLFLGTGVESDPDGIHNPDALGDLNGAAPDTEEDGVKFSLLFAGNDKGVVRVTASKAGKLDAWIDFNQDNAWDDSALSVEHIFDSIDVVAGVNVLTFDMPVAALEGDTFSRFRLSSAGDLAVGGLAGDGEVEDHKLNIMPGNFVGVLPDPKDPTGKTGALFIIGTGATTAGGGADLIELFQTNHIAQDTPGLVFVRKTNGLGFTFDIFDPLGLDPTAKNVSPPVPTAPALEGAFQRIYIFGLSGNDTILADDNFYSDFVAFGGAGDDRISGGQGDDVIVGGDGNDNLDGGIDGRDVIIGGAGSDFLVGHDESFAVFGNHFLKEDGNSDLLIAGSTVYDNDIVSLCGIHTEWTNGTPLATRVNNLRNGIGVVKLDPADPAIVGLDDTAVDSVFGSFARGEDWLIFSTADGDISPVTSRDIAN